MRLPPPLDHALCRVNGAESVHVRFVAPQAVLAQIPIPNRLLGGRADQLEPLLAFAQLVFVLLAHGDVLSRRKVYLLIEARHGIPEHPFVAAILAADAQFNTHHILAGHQSAACVNGDRNVVEMHQGASGSDIISSYEYPKTPHQAGFQRFM